MPSPRRTSTTSATSWSRSPQGCLRSSAASSTTSKAAALKKIGEEGLRQYVYDQTSLLAEYDEAGTAEGQVRLRLRSPHLARPAPTKAARYFSLDGLRSVVNLTDDSGSAVASYHLDAWGNFRFPTELTPAPTASPSPATSSTPRPASTTQRPATSIPSSGDSSPRTRFLGQIDEPPSLHRYLYAGQPSDVLCGRNRPRVDHGQRPAERGEGVCRCGYGVGEVIARPGVFTYQATGRFPVRRTGEWQYKARPRASLAPPTPRQGLPESPEHFVADVAEGVTTKRSASTLRSSGAMPSRPVPAWECERSGTRCGGGCPRAADGKRSPAAAACPCRGHDRPGGWRGHRSPDWRERGCGWYGHRPQHNRWRRLRRAVSGEHSDTREPCFCQGRRATGVPAPKAPTATPKRGGAGPVLAGQRVNRSARGFWPAQEHPAYSKCKRQACVPSTRPHG